MKSIAIIGTGIAGMSAAYFLKDKYDITFYEKADYVGGHTNTVTIKADDEDVFVDTGFMVYNEITYPNLTRFFYELEVPTMPTTMSFSVQHMPSGLEYSGAGLRGLFGQWTNLFNPGFWSLLLAMSRFNREATEVLIGDKYRYHTVANYVKDKKLGHDFLHKFLIPMSSAVWSSPPERILDFPIVTLVRFFKNHGFLGLRGHYQWRTIPGGSRIYRDRLMQFFPGKVLLGNMAMEVVREFNKVSVFDINGYKKTYDYAVMACHADQALRLLGGKATPAEQWLLKEFQYHHNRAILHTDASVMPKTRNLWSSWNYRIGSNSNNGRLLPSTIYYMNSLQKVSKKKDYFVSINDHGDVDPKKILWQAEYEHPLFSLQAIRAQEDLPKLNVGGPLYFCGSYFRYGFHEDAFNSGLDVARAITGERLWE
jgi:predicted NAD/FAD-binding protein